MFLDQASLLYEQDGRVEDIVLLSHSRSRLYFKRQDYAKSWDCLVEMVESLMRLQRDDLNKLAETMIERFSRIPDFQQRALRL
jgi:hypothetical protein